MKKSLDCIVKNDLIHEYLYKQKADETGLITDEIGSLSAQLVESYCGTFDGVVRADGSTEKVHDGSSLYVKTIFSMGGSDGRILLSKSNGTEIEFWIRIYGTYAQIRLSEDGTTTHDYNINHGQSILNDGKWHTLEVNFTPNNLILMLDDVSHNVTVSESTIYSANDTILYVGWIGTSIPFIGKMAYMNVNNFSIFNFSEGNLNTLYNTGVGSDITLSNFDPTFWDATQDVNHYNYLNGFDLWENGTAGEEIRVPIGNIVTQVGYTFSGSYPAKIGLNNCETKIKFDNSIITTYPYLNNPLSYSDFEADFGGNHEVYSFKIDKNHKSILIYNPALTPDLDLKLTKCQAKQTNLEILTDPNGDILVDPDGYVIITEV